MVRYLVDEKAGRPYRPQDLSPRQLPPYPPECGPCPFSSSSPFLPALAHVEGLENPQIVGQHHLCLR